MFKKILLDNGLPLLTESASDVRSLCIGIWVKVGSRDENPEKNGISHFLEHMFFKGTDRRSPQDIAMEIDSLGGEINAVTSSEYTLFYIKVLDEYLDKALDLLSDIFMNSTFPEDELPKEKGIIREEISMVEDTPSDYVHDLFSKHLWGSSGLGQAVLGTRETIDAFTRDDLVDHVNRFYGEGNIVIGCSGHFDEARLVERLNATLGQLERKSAGKNFHPSEFHSDVNIITKDLSEAHICLGLNGLPYNTDERYTMHLLNTVLGSGFSSRLFQKVREERGLVYSIFSYHMSYLDAGVWSVYAGTERKNVSEVIDITVNEMRNLSSTVTEEELVRAKAQLKGNLILALESTSNKMNNIAKQEIYYGRYYTPEDIIAMVEAIKLESVKDLAERLSSEAPFALTIYGPTENSDLSGVIDTLK
ncbi:MAG: insulinase family protein [Nitrospira sp.]|nr:insulinase family protein [bacterium]MBL7049971.1 insulinase family protein [Nitrospira sp.]